MINAKRVVLHGLVAGVRLASVLLLALLASTSVGSTAAAEPDAEIRAELQRYYADFSARDWEKFADHFWPGATITTVWTPPGESAARVVVTSIPDFVAKAPEGPGSKPIFEEKMTGAEMRVQGNLAQVWARYEARFGEPGQVAEWSGTDAFILMKNGGRWRIVALAFTGDE